MSSETLPPFLIGIDLGGTNIHAGIVDARGRVVCREFLPTCVHEGRDQVIERICKVIQVLSETHEDCPIEGIGIGSAGIIDMEKGIIVTSPNLPGWHDVPLREIIAERFNTQTVLDNDANAATFAEYWIGAGQGKRSVIGLTLGTGVGGGIILDGRLWHGFNGMAGEIGHMTIVPDGLQCSCGNHGCLEAYASATAIVKRTRERLAHAPSIDMLRLAGVKDPAELTSLGIYRAARAGEVLAAEIYRETGAYLGLAIGNLINILNPEMFIIGGGVSKAWDLIYPSMMQEIRKRAMSTLTEKVRIAPAQLGDDAGFIGAAGLAADFLKLNP